MERNLEREALTVLEKISDDNCGGYEADDAALWVVYELLVTRWQAANDAITIAV